MKAVRVLLEFRDKGGKTWLTAGWIDDEVRRGDNRRSVTEEHEKGNDMFVQKVTVVVDSVEEVGK